MLRYDQERLGGRKAQAIPYDNIPRRPDTRISLLKARMDEDKLVQSMHLQNSRISMDDWGIIKEEEPQENSQLFLLHIHESTRWHLKN